MRQPMRYNSEHIFISCRYWITYNSKLWYVYLWIYKCEYINYDIQIKTLVMWCAVSNHKLTTIKCINTKSICEFIILNQGYQIIINVKAEFQEGENLRIRRFWHILNHRTDNWKYASFEGVQIAQTPWFYRQKGTKKALLKSAEN